MHGPAFNHMSLSHLSIGSLEKLIVLVKKREALQAELAAIENQLVSALGTTPAPASKPKPATRKARKTKGKAPRGFKPAASPVATKPEAKPTQPAKSAKTGKRGSRGRRGALKQSILAALKSAGPSGLSVKELSAKTGAKNQNLHVWFSTTGKSVSGLKKTKAGTWALA